MFNKNVHDFGEVTQQREYTTSFTSTHEIVAATADCGCTIPFINGKQLQVTAKMPKVPASMDVYHFNRRIQVSVKDGDKVHTQILTITAIVKR